VDKPAAAAGTARSVNTLHRMPTPRLVGINHVALEVGDLEEALRFWGSLFEIEVEHEPPDMAFIEMGDQFLALSKGAGARAAGAQHFGLVVDDKEAVRAAAVAAGLEVSRAPAQDQREPWGYHLQVVE
jgi:catechol 2,3-dioxygenase-like lactoylglutathione lyase family enzyme